MAERLNKMHAESVLKRIKTTQLLNRLQNHGLGKLKKPLDRSQVTAITFLIERSLPKAEGVRKLEHSGSVTLEQAIAAARSKSGA